VAHKIFGRIATSPLRLLPDFLIVGAARCGTSSLYHYLCQHPSIGRAQTKEVHYFDVNYDKSSLWYRAHFPTIGAKWLHGADGKPFVTGEATAYYLFHPHVPKRVFERMPNVKVIALLRNPIDRAYSHYQRSVRRGREKMSFEEATLTEADRLRAETEKIMRDVNYRSRIHRQLSYVARGIYADQLKLWLDFFPRQQMLIVRSEDFFADVGGTLEQIQNFLGIRYFNIEDRKTYKKGLYTKMEPATRRRLVDYFAPHNERLKQLLGRDFGWDQ
jgi:hypothetical protein